MKTVILVTAAWFVHGVLSARADVAPGTTKVLEHFLGSNAEAYAILRTETEVAADTGITRTKTYLNEYPKVPAAGRTLEQRMAEPGPQGNPEINDEVWYGFTRKSIIRSTLLADISQAPGGGADASTGNGAPEATVHSTESGPPMPSVMTYYPNRTPVPWAAEKAALFLCDDYSREITYKTLKAVSTGLLDNRLFGNVRSKYDRNPEYGTLAVEAVADDDNATFVTVSRTVGGIKSSAILCVPPELSSQLRTLADCDDYYLCAGTFKSRAEAIDCARKLREMAKGNPLLDGHEMEVWSERRENYQVTIYVVAVSHSMETVRKREVARMEEILGMPLALRTSKRYQIRLRE